MSGRFNPKEFYKETERQVRLKIRSFTKDKSVREDIRRNDGLPSVAQGQHLYYRMAMRFDDALPKREELIHKIEESRIASSIKIRNYVREKDAERLMNLYNEIFLAAPDPSRAITLEEVENFDEDKTFIATLGSSMVGFTMLFVEPDFYEPELMAGAIAGIGVLARYRGKRIGLTLLKFIIDYFEEKQVQKLVCEVYKENEASQRMFEGLGMEIVGYMILEDEDGRNTDN